MKISVVTTLYYSEKYIKEFILRTKKTLSTCNFNDYEIILVNDGSPDNSLRVASEICQNDSSIKVINLSRNFGHYKAILTGLEHSNGDFVFLLDVDLEDQPEWLGLFYSELDRKKSDVVYGAQNLRRNDKFFGNLYYKLASFMLDLDHPKNITTARLMTKKYVEAVLMHKEKHFVISGLWVLAGFSQYPIEVNRKKNSKSTYSLSMKIRIVLDILTSMSSKPLNMIFWFGLIATLISFLLVIWLIIGKLLNIIQVSGWTSIIVTNLLIGGIVIFMQGILALYIASIHKEVKNRPNTIIKEIIKKK